MPNSKRAAGSAVSPHRNLEKELCDWVADLRNNGLTVTTLSIRTKVLQFTSKYHLMQFKFSGGWCTKYMNRCELTQHQKAHIAQNLPKDIDEKDRFANFALKERKMHEFTLENIGNMDVTRMDFVMSRNTTVERMGNETVTIETTGCEKQQFIVMLSCQADGKKSFVQWLSPKGRICRMIPFHKMLL